MKVNQICKWCKKDFLVDQKELRRGNGMFCTRSCSSKHRGFINKVQDNENCRLCENSLYRNPAQRKNSKSGLFFCSRKCKDIGQRISSGITEVHPDHYKDGSGINYRKLAKENLDLKCSRCPFDKIPEILEVHHKDRNRKNNDLSNLEILCPNCHEEEHFLNGDGRYHYLKK